MTWATPYIAKLKLGETVLCKPPGNSMHPLIRNRQPCTIAPVGERDLRTRDIVLCTVGRKHYLHLITAVRGDQYQISNNQGHVNGWITRNGIHGVLVGKE